MASADAGFVTAARGALVRLRAYARGFERGLERVKGKALDVNARPLDSTQMCADWVAAFSRTFAH